MAGNQRFIFIIVMVFGLFKCKDSEPKDELFEKFKTELTKQNLKIDSVDSEGLFHIDLGTMDIKVSIENLRRNYIKNKDSSLIIDFVSSLKATSEDIPNWNIAKDSIFYSLFPSDFEYNKVINNPVTKDLHKVYIYCTTVNNTWLTKDDILKWKISEEEFEQQVKLNVNKLLENAKVEIDMVEGKKLGYFSLYDETLKGSLLLSTKLKNKVEKDFGWPIYAVIPVRDFCYIFSEKNSKFFIDRLGNTVVKEFKESSYPISTEILKITDKGIEAIGKFQQD